MTGATEPPPQKRPGRRYERRAGASGEHPLIEDCNPQESNANGESRARYVRNGRGFVRGGWRMIGLVRPRGQVEYPEDVARIRAAMNADGYDASDSDIAWAYADWSEDVYCATWMSLDSFADISSAVLVVIERLEDAE